MVDYSRHLVWSEPLLSQDYNYVKSYNREMPVRNQKSDDKMMAHVIIR